LDISNFHITFALSNLSAGNNISILDMMGKLVTSKKYKGESKKYIVNVEDLPAGLYFIKIKTYNGEIMRKFVKQ